MFLANTSRSPRAGFIRVKADTSQFTAAMRALGEVVEQGTANADIKAGVQDGLNVYMGFIRRRFSAASGSPGNPWPDLAPSTKYERLRRGVGGFKRTKGITRQDRLRAAASVQLPILYDSGSLYSSFVPGELGYAEFWWPGGVSFGSAIPYAAYHQYGTRRMPARPIIVPPTDDVLESIKRSITAGIQSAFTAAIASI